MTKYKRLTLEEREKIHALVNQGKSNRQISAELKRSHTTISRELRRCGTKFEYSPSKAQKKTRGKAPLRGRKKLIDIRPEVFDEVIKRLNLRNSPEQISESIYKYIDAFPRGNLRKLFTGFLRSERKLRKDRSHDHSRRGGIPDATPISQRP
jgi:IS30 family transposase